LAHAERIDCLRDEPRRAAALKGKTGARIQMNAGALLHAPFSAERRFCRALLRNNLADCVASDAHNTTSRPPCLGRCRKALAGRLGEPDALRLTGGNQADWLGL
jgi:protein-tyrosine phosphatase